MDGVSASADVAIHIDSLPIDHGGGGRGEGEPLELATAILSALRDDVRLAGYLPNGTTVTVVDERGVSHGE